MTSPLQPYNPPVRAHEQAGSAALPQDDSEIEGEYRGRRGPRWEAVAVFVVTLAVLSTFAGRIVTYLSPPTGDEPFYLMTAISLLKDGDLNECNNYIQQDEAALYPAYYSQTVTRPEPWRGWDRSPYPLPPHPALIVPASRQCSSDYSTWPTVYDNPQGELYSKHGLGLTLLVLPAFAVGGRDAVVLFLNALGALLAANIFLFAREATGKLAPALLTWAAFAFTAPAMPYSYLIFPELPAALLTLYAFRRTWLWNNNAVQNLAIGLCVGFLPWLHYRFAPICAGLMLFYAYQWWRRRRLGEAPKPAARDWAIVLAPVLVSAGLLMLFFYERYGVPWPNASDHAGISDVPGTIRGIAGLFLDQQWGLFIAAPVFILCIVGVVLMLTERAWRRDLLWIGVVFVPYFLIVANYAQWWGEWCPPARYLASILPLTALPFAVALANIKGVTYRAVYGVLLALSLLTVWGFLQQPQWMYNQPTGKALVLTEGLPKLATALKAPFLREMDLPGHVPSFVRPYFAYYDGIEQGNAAVDAAWRNSLWLFAAIFGLVAFCLALAAMSRGKRDPDTPAAEVPSQGAPDMPPAPPTGAVEFGFALYSNGHTHPHSARNGLLRPRQSTPDRASAPAVLIETPTRPRRMGNRLMTVASKVVALRARFSRKMRDDSEMVKETVRGLGMNLLPQPRMVPAYVGADSRCVSRSAMPHTLAFTSSNGQSGGGNGKVDDGLLPTHHAQDSQPVKPALSAQPAQQLQSQANGATRPKRRWRDNTLWRSRGLWVTLLAIGLAMFAQKLTTVDKQIVLSIRWYALAIIVLLVGLLGTYKNRSFLVVPVGRVKSAVKERTERTVMAEPSAVLPAREVAAAAATPVSAGAVVGLPVRKVGARASETAVAEAGNANGHHSEVTSTLPVRRKPGSTSAAVTTSGGNGGEGGERDGDDDGSSHTVSTPATPAVPSTLNGPDGAVDLDGASTITAGGRRSPFALFGRIEERFPGFSRMWWRYLLALVALGINLWSTAVLRSTNYASPPASWGWLLSLALLVVVFLREPKRKVRELDPKTDVIEETDTRIPRWLEITLLFVIFGLALGMRLFKLGDWTTGMHGDEGEAGMEAINIMEGNRVSPFLTGWFFQPNFYYWGIAGTMWVFGTDLFGLRMFSTLIGALMIFPFYGLVRMWFGVRTAIIAGILLAVSDVAIHYSRAEFSNITTPFFIVCGFYFLFRGLRTKRTLEFVLSGYSFMLTMFFYTGGRLAPFLVAGVFAYIFLAMPIVRMPGTFFALRREIPGLGLLRAAREAIVTQAKTVLHYGGQVVVFAIACIMFAAPWVTYYVDNQRGLNERASEKSIFNNEAQMTAQYGAQHTPLYVGLRMPTDNDVYPFLPVVFEKTPISVKISDDGYWGRVLWGQLYTSLSLLTYRFEMSSIYTFSGEAVAKPIEAALLILGIAWAFWRWRDTRMAMISLWFWSAVLSGGVMTIDAPYMARMVHIIPVLALAAALPLSKAMAELVRFGQLVARRLRSARPKRAVVRTAQALGAVAAGLVLFYLSIQNFYDYYNRYTMGYPFTDVTGQATFVRDMNQKVEAEGRPVPRYYHLGAHFIYWSHGDNRFLNHGTPGSDMVNASDDMPPLDTGRDVVYMVFPHTQGYLSVLRQYYPNGIEEPYQYGPQALLTSYRVKQEEIEARRMSHATYTPAGGGQVVARDEPSFGTGQGLPDGIAYPATAAWTGGVVAPSYGRYKFAVDSAGPATLMIDGRQVITLTQGLGHAEADLVLARGLHDLRLEGTLANADAQLTVQWSVGGPQFSPIARQYLFNGPGRAFFGQVMQGGGDLLNPGTSGLGGVISNRVDGFLGFRDPTSTLGGGAITAIWKGTLDIKEAGSYSFDTYSCGDSIILIDGQLVVNNIRGGIDAHQASGQVTLEPGPHSFELRYNWMGGRGYLEAFWTPPNGQRGILGPEAMRPATEGIIDPSSITSEPPPVRIEPDAPPERVAPVQSFAPDLNSPRGLAVDSKGNIYVGDRANHRVVVLSPDGQVLRSWGKAAPAVPGGRQPPEVEGVRQGEFFDIIDVAVSGDDTVYVFDTANRVQAFSTNGDPKGTYEPNQLGIYGPDGIGAGRANLYIGIPGQNRVLRLPPLTGVAPSSQPPAGMGSILVTSGDNFEQPVDVAPDPSVPDGSILYVIDLKDRIMQVKAPQGGAEAAGDTSWTIVKQWRVAVGREDGGSRLAVSPDGHFVYMSDPDRKRVAVLDVAKNKITYFGGQGSDSGEFGAPLGIATSLDGRVYVLDRDNRNVQVFTPTSK